MIVSRHASRTGTATILQWPQPLSPPEEKSKRRQCKSLTGSILEAVLPQHKNAFFFGGTSCADIESKCSTLWLKQAKTTWCFKIHLSRVHLSSEAMDFSKWESSISQSTTWYNTEILSVYKHPHHLLKRNRSVIDFRVQ